jgi:beta-lactamase regulating signal transducer with metallopeptidase domain
MIDWGSLAPDAVRIGFSAELPSPALIGWLQPVILLPADLASWPLRPEERALIIQHELTHLQRRDHYATLFQTLLSTVFFFHPLVRYGCRQLSLERELACDDRVLGLGHCKASAYVESLLKVAERSLCPES